MHASEATVEDRSAVLLVPLAEARVLVQLAEDIVERRNGPVLITHDSLVDLAELVLDAVLRVTVIPVLAEVLWLRW